MDQCTHCTMRGNLQGCLTTTCSQHESWMVGELRKALNAAAELMHESHGVTGLHLNGDVAPWDELRTGGRYEEWLVDFDAALVRPNDQVQEPPKAVACNAMLGCSNEERNNDDL